MSLLRITTLLSRNTIDLLQETSRNVERLEQLSVVLNLDSKLQPVGHQLLEANEQSPTGLHIVSILNMAMSQYLEV